MLAGRTVGPRYDVVNLGTGRGTSVRELVEVFGEVLSNIACA